MAIYIKRWPGGNAAGAVYIERALPRMGQQHPPYSLSGAVNACGLAVFSDFTGASAADRTGS